MDGNIHKNALSHLDSEPLSAEEIKELRIILRNRDRQKWLLSTVRLWLGYLSACVIALYAVWDNISRLLARH